MARFRGKPRAKFKEKEVFHDANAAHDRAKAIIAIEVKLRHSSMPDSCAKAKKNVIMVRKVDLVEEKKWEWLCCKVCLPAFILMDEWIGRGSRD